MTPALTFLGAAGTVTGAKFLLEIERRRLLLECGLFQGLRELRERNWAAPPVAPDGLGAVLISHAHIDHCGYLPRLVRDGFAGPIFCSRGTADLLAIMLPDAARLQEEEAEFRNRVRATRHQPALALFATEDADRTLKLVRPVEFGAAFIPVPGFVARLLPSGHILGASIVQVEAGGRRLVYSGDLGRYDVPVLRDPDVVRNADTLLVESTYGNRRHPADDGMPVIETALHGAARRGGALLIPAFAVGRTQELLYLIRQLEEEGRVPRLPVYLDSPMGTAATAIYARHPEEHDAETARIAAAGRRPFTPARFHVVTTVEASKRLNGLEGPVVIVAGSGMATGGRILHHLRQRVGDERTTVLFVGYQAAGTRGRLLRDGARRLRVFGEDLPVRATVLATDALSAHADQAELLRWLRGFDRPPAATWTVHGEPDAALSLRDAVERELGWRNCRVAADGARVEI